MTVKELLVIVKMVQKTLAKQGVKTQIHLKKGSKKKLIKLS